VGSARGGANHELFAHGADIGIRGIASSKAAAFVGAALALTAAVTDPSRVRGITSVAIDCQAPNDVTLLIDWINAVIFEMAVRKMLFSRFEVAIDDNHQLTATAWGEPVDRVRHEPAAEPKGATYTEARVERSADGLWTAQCVVDV
jgi:tRNA nucleotidyltransferase (CCA-adding enzyme)